jgi:hypothetical protein
LLKPESLRCISSGNKKTSEQRPNKACKAGGQQQRLSDSKPNRNHEVRLVSSKFIAGQKPAICFSGRAAAPETWVAKAMPETPHG